ncbi:unnamed protein product, partial [Mesorhabditis spiculigera]
MHLWSILLHVVVILGFLSLATAEITEETTDPGAKVFDSIMHKNWTLANFGEMLPEFDAFVANSAKFAERIDEAKKSGKTPSSFDKTKVQMFREFLNDDLIGGIEKYLVAYPKRTALLQEVRELMLCQTRDAFSKKLNMLDAFSRIESHPNWTPVLSPDEDDEYEMNKDEYLVCSISDWNKRFGCIADEYNATLTGLVGASRPAVTRQLRSLNNRPANAPFFLLTFGTRGCLLEETKAIYASDPESMLQIARPLMKLMKQLYLYGDICKHVENGSSDYAARETRERFAKIQQTIKERLARAPA